jgi:hypothetical protein
MPHHMEALQTSLGKIPELCDMASSTKLSPRSLRAGPTASPSAPGSLLLGDPIVTSVTCEFLRILSSPPPRRGSPSARGPASVAGGGVGIPWYRMEAMSAHSGRSDPSMIGRMVGSTLCILSACLGFWFANSTTASAAPPSILDAEPNRSRARNTLNEHLLINDKPLESYSPLGAPEPSQQWAVRPFLLQRISDITCEESFSNYWPCHRL